MFNPSDHEGWLVWVCLLCINPRGGGTLTEVSPGRSELANARFL